MHAAQKEQDVRWWKYEEGCETELTESRYEKTRSAYCLPFDIKFIKSNKFFENKLCHPFPRILSSRCIAFFFWPKGPSEEKKVCCGARSSWTLWTNFFSCLHVHTAKFRRSGQTTCEAVQKLLMVMVVFASARKWTASKSYTVIAVVQK